MKCGVKGISPSMKMEMYMRGVMDSQVGLKIIWQVGNTQNYQKMKEINNEKL